jgi:undecaprenyl diphosphate synthase
VWVLGELERLDDATRDAVVGIQEATRGGRALRLNLMISYGGREELVRAARALAREAAEGRLDPDEVDEEAVEGALFTAGLSHPDLLIRTSGERRLSNFLLWQLAYAEWHISSVLWPDFRREDLYEAILDYQRRERRFGRVSAP